MRFFVSLVDVKYAVQCESTTMKLSCPTDSKIVIVKGIYGRDKYSSACGDYFFEGNCTSRVDVEQKLKSLCNNQQTCSIYVGSANFQDPCPPDIAKILKVWYQCIGNGRLNILFYLNKFVVIIILIFSLHDWW